MSRACAARLLCRATRVCMHHLTTKRTLFTSPHDSHNLFMFSVLRVKAKFLWFLVCVICTAFLIKLKVLPFVK